MKKLFIFMMASMLFMIVACSNDSEKSTVEVDEEALENLTDSGFPIVNEEITLDFFAAKSAQNVNIDWNDILIWNEYEKMTNINIDWNQIQPDALQEQRNLALAGGDLPDVFYLSGFSNSDLYRYGQQNTFLSLNDLIEEHAPNLNKLMEEDPSIRKGLTFPDGNIYSMPTVVDSDFLSVRIGSRPWFNQTWLDELGMSVPETTDEFYEYLKAVKELDPVGNGNTVPYGGTSINEIVEWLSGSFGVANRGVRNGPVDLDVETDQLRLYATTDEYKEMLEYINKLYSEQLIEQNIFTIEWGQFLANASEGVYASMLFYDPIELFGEEIGEHYNSGSALMGPNGDQMYIKVAPVLNSMGNFVITSENPNPAATVRWMDHFYGDEGSKFYYMGIEGETYEETEDGDLVYTDKILNPPDGSTFEQELSKYLSWLGGNTGILKEEFFRGSESAPMSLEATEKIEPYVIEEVWSNFTYTDEENKVLTSTGADIEKYVTEMRDNFISGDTPFSEWDNYVQTLESMDLEEYLEVKQAAYDRYKGE